jgi:GR25 family glycosyltransferase involved in LPS biosynthesis
MNFPSLKTHKQFSLMKTSPPPSCLDVNNQWGNGNNNQSFHMATIDHVYVVNKDSRDDRLSRILTKLDASDLKYTPRSRIPARDGGREDFTAYMTETAQNEAAVLLTSQKRKFAVQMTRAGAGSYMSHMDVWQLVASMSARSAHILVLEDDVVVPPDINARLRSAWTKLTQTRHHVHRPFLVVWAAGEHVVSAQDVNKIVKNSKPLEEDPGASLSPAANFWGMQAYSLTPDTASALLDPRSGLLPMDTQLEAALLQPRTRKAVDVYLCPRLGMGGGAAKAESFTTEHLLPLNRLPAGMDIGTYPRMTLVTQTASASAVAVVPAVVIPVVILVVLVVLGVCLGLMFREPRFSSSIQ